MVEHVKLQSDGMGKTCFLLGCGYTARALIPALRARGFEIFGTTRSDGKAKELRVLGITPLVFTGAITKQMRDALARTTHLICSIGPNGNGDPYAHTLAPYLSSVQWAAYLSATSVYGDRQGKWVFEEELLYPQTGRGRARILAELDWAETGLPVHLFRIAGIYGPGRNAFKRIRGGTAKAIIKKDHISNRIHVDDIAAALLASMDRPNPLQIYNLADDHPAPPQDVMQYAAKLLGTAPLPEIAFEAAEMSDMARSFYKEVRRTANRRAKSELGWQPHFPSYKDGLQAILKMEKSG